MQKSIELQKAKAAYPNAIITEGFLRSDIPVSSTVSSLNFNFLASQPNSGATSLTPKERNLRLKLSDAFLVTGWKLCIYKAGAASPTEAQQSTPVEYSYPNASVFSGSGEAANFEALYNSVMNVTVNKTEYFSQYWANVFRRVNQAQAGAVTAAITGPTTYTTPAEQQDGKNNGFVGIEQTFYMSGAWDMSFQLILPSAVSLAGTSSLNYVSLILAGFVIGNGAQYKF
jgi:hypothetical protein